MPPLAPTEAALGSALRDLREEKELTQEALARRASVGVRVVSKLESGAGNPTWATLMAILGGLDASLSALAKKMEDELSG